MDIAIIAGLAVVLLAIGFGLGAAWRELHRKRTPQPQHVEAAGAPGAPDPGAAGHGFESLAQLEQVAISTAGLVTEQTARLDRLEARIRELELWRTDLAGILARVNSLELRADRLDSRRRDPGAGGPRLVPAGVESFRCAACGMFADHAQNCPYWTEADPRVREDQTR